MADQGKLVYIEQSEMEKLINILQIVLAILLMGAILLQQRGTTLGGAFGGEGAVFRSRRGIEKTLFFMTIILAVLFVLVSLLNVLKTKLGIVG